MASSSSLSGSNNSSSESLIVSFILINKAWSSPSNATQDQKERFEAQDLKLQAAKLASLDALVLIIHHQIERTSIRYSNARLTLDQIRTVFNQLRRNSGEAELSEDWELGFVLWNLLDRTGRRFLHSFHSFVPIRGKHQGHTTFLSLEFQDNPYPRASPSSQLSHLHDLSSRRTESEDAG